MARLSSPPLRDNPAVATPRDRAPIVSRFAADAALRDVLDMYVNELAPRLEALRADLDAGRLDAVRAAAHQFVTSGVAYGFPEISRAALALETEAGKALSVRGDRLESVRRGLEELAGFCTRARAR